MTKLHALLQAASSKSLRSISYERAEDSQRDKELAYILFRTPYVERLRQRQVAAKGKGKRRRKGTAGGPELQSDHFL